MRQDSGTGGGARRHGAAGSRAGVSLIKPAVKVSAIDEIDLAGIASAAREQLARREADADLVAELRSAGFGGRRYRRFEYELIDYAVEVFQAWLATGHIFKLTADRGRNLKPSDTELERLRTDRDHRRDVAAMTITKALKTFKERALVGGRWSPAGGATLTTYFMGATVYAYSNVLRDDRAARTREYRERVAAAQVHNRGRRVLSDMTSRPGLDGDAVEFTLDPSISVVGRVEVDETLEAASERERTILAMYFDGYTQEEIAEITGDKTVRSIEGVIYRWRKKQQRSRGHDAYVRNTKRGASS